MEYTKLKYDKFKNYLFSCNEKENSMHYVFKFDNGYGASVIKNLCSYGNEYDLYELAVIRFTSDDLWELCYQTGITSDVIGYLNNDEILSLLEGIKIL
ncbi:hypothetical protein [Floccifex sp.]|uniref:hypothetical protein n=1 Tax=Floccifex sp. TaxID=2815810 RepID=UPI003F078D4C